MHKPRKYVVLPSSLHCEHDISGPENNYEPNIITYYNSTKTDVDTFDKLQNMHVESVHVGGHSLFMRYTVIAAYNAFVVSDKKPRVGKS